MTAERLWMDDNGMLSCEAHAGNYLQHAIARRPRAKSHSTPRGRWVLLTDAEVAIIAADCGTTVTCESCAYAARCELCGSTVKHTHEEIV